MRLIDADAIPYVLVNGLTSTRSPDKDIFDIAYRYVIDKQPTVEAIPISYIAAEIFQLHEYRNHARKREERDEIMESISCLENLVRRYREQKEGDER